MELKNYMRKTGNFYQKVRTYNYDSMDCHIALPGFVVSCFLFQIILYSTLSNRLMIKVYVGRMESSFSLLSDGILRGSVLAPL